MARKEREVKTAQIYLCKSISIMFCVLLVETINPTELRKP